MKNQINENVVIVFVVLFVLGFGFLMKDFRGTKASESFIILESVYK
jgi:hypothetical protein